jgi:hypothetical protein
MAASRQELPLAGSKSNFRFTPPESRLNSEIAACPKSADTVEKSFLHDERNFLGPLMRFARSDVRDHIASHKNSHRPSYRR